MNECKVQYKTSIWIITDCRKGSSIANLSCLYLVEQHLSKGLDCSFHFTFNWKLLWLWYGCRLSGLVKQQAEDGVVSPSVGATDMPKQTWWHREDWGSMWSPSGSRRCSSWIEALVIVGERQLTWLSPWLDREDKASLAQQVPGPGEYQGGGRRDDGQSSKERWQNGARPLPGSSIHPSIGNHGRVKSSLDERAK